MKKGDANRLAEIVTLAARLPFAEYPIVLTELRHADPLVSSHPTVDDFLIRMQRRLLGFQPVQLITSLECVLKWSDYTSHALITESFEHLEHAHLSVLDCVRLLHIFSKVPPHISLLSRVFAVLEKNKLAPPTAIDVLLACARMSYRPPEALRRKLAIGAHSKAALAYAQLHLPDFWQTWDPTVDFHALHPEECFEWILACTIAEVLPPVSLVDALIASVRLLRPDESLDVAAALIVNDMTDSIAPFIDSIHGDDEKMQALYIALGDARLEHGERLEHLQVPDAWEERPLCDIKHPDAEYAVLVDDFYTIDLVIDSVAVDVYPEQLTASVWQRLKWRHLQRRGYKPLFIFKDWCNLPVDERPDFLTLARVGKEGCAESPFKHL